MRFDVPQVACNAIVDIIRKPKEGHKGLAVYRVEVWGRDPYDYARTYEISEKTDTLAAQEGIRRFVEEMERLDIK